MLDHFLTVGGNEVVNSARAYRYALTAGCAANWLRDPECDTIAAAAGSSEYDYAEITEAPWYDPDDPDATGRFLGLYGIEIRGLSDSTRSATVTEKTTDGGVVSGYRHASREVRVRAWMTAKGLDALEAGMTWLRNVLEPNACGVHGGACGEADAGFFVDCPPPPGEVTEDVPGGYGDGPYGDTEYGDGPETITITRPQTEAEYQVSISDYRRFLHEVRCVSGPFTIAERESQDGVHLGRLVEFTLVAGVPWVYGMPKEIDVPPITPTVVEDIAYNRAPYPSAEISEGTVVAAVNYATNPSLETDSTGWGTAQVGLAGVTHGRVTGELAAAGVASYRQVFTPSVNSTGAGYYQAAVTTDIPTTPGARYSLSIWAAQVVTAGAPVRGIIEVDAVWRDGLGNVLRTDVMPNIPNDGGYSELKSRLPPAGAERVQIRVYSWVTSYVIGDSMRTYLDALAVTNP